MTSFAGLAAIFDLDGTLIHSAPDVRASASQALMKYGRRELTLDETKELVGWGARVLVEKALRLTGEPGDDAMIEAIQDDFLTFYAAHPVDHSSVFPGVMDVLNALRDDGVRMGLCTNKPEKTTAPVLEAFGLGGYFEVMACGDTLPYRKPDGRHVTWVMEALGSDRARALMVGDSENDITAAINADVRSVAVTYGYAHAPYPELGADALIDDFADLPSAWRRIREGSAA